MTVTATAPVAAPPRHRRRWIWITVALVTAVLVVLALLAVTVAVAFRRQQNVPVTFRRPITMLRLGTPDAAVTVAPGPPGLVRVERFLTWRLGPPPQVTTAWSGRTLQVTVPGCSSTPLRWCSAQVVIQVPAGTALRASAGAGNLAVSALTGPLHVRLTSGMVSLNGVSGPVWARATSGMISASGLSAARVDAAVSSGNLSLQFAAPPQRVSALATSGIIAVTVPPGARYRVLGSAPAGVWGVVPGLVSRTSPRLITAAATTGSGSVGYGPGFPPAPAGHPAQRVSPAPLGS